MNEFLAPLSPILSDVGHIWLGNLIADTRRYVIFSVAVWFALWVVLRTLLARRRIRSERAPNRQLLSEFAFSIRSIAIFSTMGIAITLLDRAGFYPLARPAAAWGPVWFAVSLIVMIVAQDAYVYWVHRWMHRPRWFRTFHRRHHKSHNPSPFTAYSFDLGEAALMVSFVILWPLVMPTPWMVVPLFMLHQIVRNTLLHAGYELMPARPDGRPFLDFLATTTHHDLHHGQAGYNFAPWFTWWDRWMGTEHPQYYERYARAAWRPFARRPAVEPALITDRSA